MCPSPNHVELSVNRHLPVKEKKKEKEIYSVQQTKTKQELDKFSKGEIGS